MQKYKLLILFFILFAAETHANTLRIELNPESGNIERYFIVKDLNYYLISTGATDLIESYDIKAIYKDGTIVSEKPYETGKVNFENGLDVKSVSIFVNNRQISKKDINLCNNNNLCEPCISNCDVSENAFSCSDCNSENDKVCDTTRNGICDPDCHDGYDIDCRAPYTTEPDISEGDLFPEMLSPEEQAIYYGNKTDEPIIEIVEPVKKQNVSYTLYFVLVIIIILFTLGYFVKSKGLIAISIFIILGFIIIVHPSEKPDEITGHLVLEPVEVMHKLCEASVRFKDEFGIDIHWSILAGIARAETNWDHWDKNGDVKVSFDGGVGLMGIDNGVDPVGTSHMVDCGVGAKLNEDYPGLRGTFDVMDIDENIQCGIRMMLYTCYRYQSPYVANLIGVPELIGNCLDPDFKVDYCCPNNVPERLRTCAYDRTTDELENAGSITGNLNVKKVYSGWDIAIRGHNGWACGPYEGNRIYVEKVRAAQQEALDTFGEDFCGAAPAPWHPEDVDLPEGPTIPGDEEGPISENIFGYYYLNPAFRIKEDVEISKYYEVIADAENLVQACNGRADLDACVWSQVKTLKRKGWHITACNFDPPNDVPASTVIPPDDFYSRRIRFCVETGKYVKEYTECLPDYDFKPVEIKFALYFEESPQCTGGLGTSCSSTCCSPEASICCNTESFYYNPSTYSTTTAVVPKCQADVSACVQEPLYVDASKAPKCPENTDLWADQWATQDCRCGDTTKFLIATTHNTDGAVSEYQWGEPKEGTQYCCRNRFSAAPCISEKYLGTFPECSCGEGLGNTWDSYASAEVDENPCVPNGVLAEYFISGDDNGPGKCCNIDEETKEDLGNLNPEKCPGATFRIQCLESPTEEMAVEVGDLLDMYQWSIIGNCEKSELGQQSCNGPYYSVCAFDEEENPKWYEIRCVNGCGPTPDPHCMIAGGDDTLEEYSCDMDQSEADEWVAYLTGNRVTTVQQLIDSASDIYWDSDYMEPGSTECQDTKSLSVMLCNNHAGEEEEGSVRAIYECIEGCGRDLANHERFMCTDSGFESSNSDMFWNTDENAQWTGQDPLTGTGECGIRSFPIEITNYIIGENDELKEEFGQDQEEVSDNLVYVNLLGRTIGVHSKAAQAFRNVQAKIEQLQAENNLEYPVSVMSSAVPFRYINTPGGSSRLSWHSFGIAVDMNYGNNPRCGASDPDQRCEGNNDFITDMPLCLVNAFKENGFTWGGDYDSRDPMHFQWHGWQAGFTPILTDPGTVESSGGSSGSEGTDIVLFGDSITVGHELYGADLIDMLEDQGISYDVDGVTGATTSSSQSRFNDILASAPEYVLLWFGMNFEDRSSFRENYENWIDQMQAAGITPIIITTIPDCPESREYIVERVNDEKAIAQEKGIGIIDVRPVIQNHVAENGCDIYAGDGIHLTGNGHDLISPLMYNELVSFGII